MPTWLTDFLHADRRRIFGGVGIGGVCGSLVWSSLSVPGGMGMLLLGCGALGVVAGVAILAEETGKARDARVAREVADAEEMERLRAGMRADPRPRLPPP